MRDLKTRNLILIGIIGSFFAIASDFLIGYIDIGKAVKLQFGYFGTNIPNWRAFLSIIFAYISYIAYMVGYKGLALQLERTSNKISKWFYRIFLANALTWLFIHSSFCLTIYLYNVLTDYEIVQKLEITKDFVGLYFPFVSLLFATNTIPLLFLGYHILRGNTVFPKKFILVNPMFMTLIAFIPWKLFGETAFWHAIFLSGGNIGVCLLFISAFLFENKSKQ